MLIIGVFQGHEFTICRYLTANKQLHTMYKYIHVHYNAFYY